MLKQTLTLLVLLFLFAIQLTYTSGGSHSDAKELASSIVPSLVPEDRIEYGVFATASPGELYKECGTCRCCTDPKDPFNCSMQDCCMIVQCNIPNRPVGTCDLVPYACGCSACNNPSGL